MVAFKHILVPTDFSAAAAHAFELAASVAFGVRREPHADARMVDSRGDLRRGHQLAERRLRASGERGPRRCSHYRLPEETLRPRRPRPVVIASGLGARLVAFLDNA